MQTKELKIGNVLLPSNVLLAPLAGYTNYAFRKTCLDYGAALAFTEMVSAKGLFYKSENTRELLYTVPEESPKAVQLFGNDPSVMEWAAKSEDIAPFDIIDVNMGCPVPKVYNNGEGSALLNDLPLAEKIIRAVKKSGKTVTVKFRIGVHKDKIVTEEFAKMCEGAGADMITIHGRTRDQMYAGTPDYAQIAKAKQAVRIPVIANGGVLSAEDADVLLSNTGADGIMVARGALTNPHIFAEITHNPVPYNRKELVRRQTELLRTFADDRFTTVFMRKMAVFYLKGMRNAAQYKDRLFRCNTPQEVLSCSDEILACDELES